MKCVFRASNGLEAHMVADLLDQVGIMAQVHGDLLQGGVGELPAMGLASVWVAESDETRAHEIIREFDRRQPALPASSSTPVASATLASFAKGFLLGLVCGALLVFAFLVWR
ncbi:hypothetical protein A11A3_03569 [Alcanivorax hongdengensis A-11-3]|uniref:DUF2007 domain-containing protein n=1 Tax=Alcanivorax hongdengensis A-11-3 TaxID=1177179 RepID=L0WFD8_9GAMM|nr:DUF2007 domain-containing protein [Alcanivorax hongdengensis]EKF75404.1 hypothetical protein A11A3_03569 [Alcanivorax hongdengensis A-11-3]